MKTPTQSISRLLSMALFGVVVLVFLLLILTGALPGSAQQYLRPEAITNPQTAAILGGQNLLVFQQISQSIYLPAVIR